MLLAMSSSPTLGDDVYHEDATTTNFEAHVASLLGHEAGLFVSSGTMGNQLALRSLLVQPPHGVLADSRAHVVNYEAGGLATLSQGTIQPVIPSNGLYLTLGDIKKHIVLGSDVHGCPTRVISLENTLGGAIYPLKEIRKIRAYALLQGIKMHCDGARLWNAVAAGAGSLLDYGACFDTISLCFSKGLGAPIGSILVSSKALITHARHVRKSIGGGMRQTGPIISAAAYALNLNFPAGLQRTHALAQSIAVSLKEIGVNTMLPVETSILFLDLEGAGLKSEWFLEEGKRRGLILGGGGRVVVHWQITDEAVRDLVDVVREVLRKMKSGEFSMAEENGEQRNGEGYGSVKLM